MVSDRYVEAVARHVATQLHRTGTGVRCRCGACGHLILMVARRLVIDPARLFRALPPAPRTEPEQPDGRLPRPAMTVFIGRSMTITRGRRRLHGIAAVESLRRHG